MSNPATQCLIYTVRNHKSHLKHLRRSLQCVMDNLVPFVDKLDIIFFYDGGTEGKINELLSELGITNEVYFRLFTAGQPSWIGGDKSYNNMCRFWAGVVFRDPKVLEYDKYMRLDCDSFITEPVGRDLFAEVGDGVYGYLTGSIMHCGSPHSRELNQTIKEFEITVPKDKLYGTIDDVRQGMLYYTNFEICNVQAINKSLYMDLFDHLDFNGGIYVHRWGDHIIRYAGLHLFFPPEAVVELKGVGYNHQGYTLVKGVPQTSEQYTELTKGISGK